MKGLLLKDFYQTVKYCRAYLVLVLVFLAVPLFSEDSMFFLVYPCVFAGMIPVTLLGYDERSRWLQYSETLPYTKAQIVSAKYLIGLAAQVLILVLAVASQAGRMATTGSFSGKELLALMTVLLVVSCVTSSITLPFMFKWGVEKGRVAYNIMIGIGCLAGERWLACPVRSGNWNLRPVVVPVHPLLSETRDQMINQPRIESASIRGFAYFPRCFSRRIQATL